MAIKKLYYKGKANETMDVNDFDADYWKKQGWEEKPAEQNSPIKDNSQPVNQGNTDQGESDKINNYIDTLPLEEQQKQLLRYISQQDYTGNKVYEQKDIDKIISDAATNAATDINPYYSTQTSRGMQDLQNKFSDIRDQANQELRQSKLSYSQKLANTKKQLRQSGLTFSGADRRALGTYGANSANGVEGTLPQQYRYDVQSVMSGAQQKARDLGLAGERELGSNALSNFNNLNVINPYERRTQYNSGFNNNLYVPTTSGNPNYVSEGDAELRRKRDIQMSKWNRINTLFNK